MRGQRIKWTKRQLAWIEKNCTMTRRELHAAFQVQFDRPEITYDNIKALCTRRGWKTGRTGRYEPGAEPANKGKKMPYHPNSARTRFKKGNRTGRAAENYKEVGSERMTRDGYLERKIHDGMPMQSRWRAVHLVNWEAINGPIPEGMCLKCLDGNKSNTNPGNWELINRGVLPFINGHRGPHYEVAPAEVKPVILTMGKLKHVKSRKTRSS